MFSLKRLPKDEALKKIKHYCSYQERCHNEVKDKLYSYGLYKVEVDEIVAVLIENNYLNEERFAQQFAGGKFRMKQWGRRKIEYELLQKGVNKANIKFALKQITNEDYTSTLKKLAEKKLRELKGLNHLIKQAKVTSYLSQKGYETTLIAAAIKELLEDAG